MSAVDALPPRAGAPWSPAEEERLLTALREAATLEGLVAEFGRTRGALMSRVRKMLPVEHPAKRTGDAVAGLHAVLADDPDYRPPMSVREELREQRRRRNQRRPYVSVCDADLITIAEALYGTMEYQSMQTASRVFHEVEQRHLWGELVDRRADLLIWRSDVALDREEALHQAQVSVDRFRNAQTGVSYTQPAARKEP